MTGTKKPINEIIVDPLTMWNVLKPSNLPDYLSLCYGISDDGLENNSKSDTGLKNSCHYGVLDDEGRVTQTHFFSPVYERNFTVRLTLIKGKCLCLEGFEGPRCQISGLTQVGFQKNS